MGTQVVQADYTPSGGRIVRTAFERFSAAGSMDWTRFESTNITAQISGTATTGTVVVERSGFDPAGSPGASAAPVDDSAFTGDLTAGVSARPYIETGVGWWRIRVTDSTGGYVDCALSGAGG